MNKYILTAACGLAFSAASAQTEALPDNPNILLILVDDLGYGDLSCQGAAKDIQTPHIDKLLNEGVRFTNFHANCPVSSPSRASLLTGRYPDMVGVPGVIRTHKEDSWGYLSEDAVLLPQMLKKITVPSAIKARIQFWDALLIADGARLRPIQIIIGPVTTGGR